MGPFSITDLFVVGLALDITGAYLLAVGLLVSSRTIALLSGQFWDYHPGDAINRVENRIDAEFGVVALGLGFLLQAMGYVVVLLGADASTGLAEGLIGLALGVVAAGAVLLAWRRMKPRRTRMLLPSVALAHGDEEGGRWTQGRAAMLLACGRRLGHEPRDGEGKIAYMRRVFGVELPPDCD
jgi:hypothetical protein